MKTTLRLLCLLIISILLTGMAEAGTLGKDQQLKKIKATSISAKTQVKALETYYGSAFPTLAIKGYKRGDSVKKILSGREIQLKNGQYLRTSDIEYAFVPQAARTIRLISGKAPHEKAPHEQN